MESLLEPSPSNSRRVTLIPSIDCTDSGWNNHPDSHSIVVRGVAQVGDYLQQAGIIPSARSIELGLDIVLGNDHGVRDLNRLWRGQDRPTNVLSFPSLEADELAEAMAADSFDGHCGDIYLALETIEREAIEQNKNFADHLHHLTIHSVLHIFGFDHHDSAEALAMETIEINLLQKFGIANPYELTHLESNEDKAAK
ncbi:MAG: rRNA maturation RNase YbeY [Candidatus Pacebacteria bacterium]|nr:rRNA maturation RNase YbeY [Candidatus Paceibacterota bacterium]